MGRRHCNDCAETVDEAKAFCPDCGCPLVAEGHRREPLRFDQSPHTQDLDEGMLLAILGDMGLDLSQPRETGPALVQNTGESSASTPQTSVGHTNFPLRQHSGGWARVGDGKVPWLTLVGVVLVLFLSFGLLAAAALVHMLWLRPGLGFLLTFLVPA